MDNDDVLVSNRDLFRILLDIISQDNIVASVGEYGGWNPGPFVRAKTNTGLFIFEIRKSVRFGKEHYRLVLGSESFENQVIEDFDPGYSKVLFDALSLPDFNKPQKTKRTFFSRLFNRSK